MSTPLASSRHQQALNATTAFTRRFDVTVTRGAVSETFTVADGSFVMDARRAMLWSADLTIALPSDSSWVPRTPADLLTNFGTTATVEAGVRLADGTDSMVPLGVYLIQAVEGTRAAGQNTVQLTLMDKALAIADYRFEAPVSTAAGDVADVVNAVILDRLGVSPGLAASGQTVPVSVFGLDPSKDPWTELQELAASRGLRLRYDRAGVLALTAPPTYLSTLPSLLEGVLRTSPQFASRPANVVVVRGEGTDALEASIAVVMDTDPASPTWAGATAGGSPYGRVTRHYSSKAITTTAEATTAATALLSSEVGAGATWSLAKAFDPTVDVDDLITTTDPTVPALAVDSVTVGIRGETTITGRAVTV
jgi:hypothetical protein